MHSLLKSLKSLFITDYKEQLRPFVDGTYAPYTQKFLAGTIPLLFTNQLPAKVVGGAGHDLFSGKSESIRINKTVYTQSLSQTLSVLEHESVHVNQISYTRPDPHRLLLRSKDLMIQARVHEIEAYGRHSYKFVRDILEGNIEPNFNREHLQDEGHIALMLMPFVSSRHHPVNDIENAIKDVKKYPHEFTEQKALSAFYNNMSLQPHFLYHTCLYALKQQEDILAEFEDPYHAFIHKKAIQKIKDQGDTDALFQNNFTFEDAKNLLDRDGGNYIGGLSPFHQNLFWKGLTTFNTTETQQLQHLTTLEEKFRI